MAGVPVRIRVDDHARAVVHAVAVCSAIGHSLGVRAGARVGGGVRVAVGAFQRAKAALVVAIAVRRGQDVRVAGRRR